MRYRDLRDAPISRRRGLSQFETPTEPELDDSTHDGLKARHRITERDVANLKRKWGVEEPFTETLIIDVGDGAVPTGHTKGHWVSADRTLVTVVATLSVAGSTDTVANIIRDGTIVGTLTIPANAQTVEVDVGAAFQRGLFWQMQQTSAGTGAGGLTYFGNFG